MLTKWPINCFRMLKGATDISARAASSEEMDKWKPENREGPSPWCTGFLVTYQENEAHLQLVHKQLPGRRSYPVWKDWWKAVGTSVLERDPVEMPLGFR